MKMYILIILIISCMAAILCACGKKSHNSETGPNKKNNEPKSGGITDNTDYSAPKEIKSDNLVTFRVNFYKESDFYYSKKGEYAFSMTTDNGVITIEEEKNGLLSEAGSDFAKRLSDVIAENGLAGENGIDRVTSGLAPEYGPVTLHAEYASGEEINFRENGDPNAKWVFDIFDLFAREFDANGIDELMPEAQTGKVTRFELQYTDGDIVQSYGEVRVPNEGVEKSFEELATNGYEEGEYHVMIFCESWGRAKGEQINAGRFTPSDEYYDGLLPIINDSDLRRFYNGEIMPGDFGYDSADNFYEFYVEFESGNVLSGFSADPEKFEQFKEVADGFAAYIESFLEN